ncbi:uncharacterized protein LOC122318983 [Carya illinoinensis]|uniref:Uncharacterized protein n=1 Tax=Carya illinoinensis TaxID=32201 RepID=A0A8T1RN52_CARIL|nr:uncharacterized protein LOC122318983 [Carya illinoinensis]KAG6668139.1 hypothetical protein CIPAW_01G150600 [Carya illinoinensis]
MVRELEALSEEERRALRGSKFAPLASLPPPPSFQPRLAHPGGPLRTNKAAALAKFLERKLQEPNGLASINPDLLEIAVQNAKHTVLSGGTSNSGSKIQHVDSFGDSQDSTDGGKVESSELKKYKKKKKKNKNKNKKTEKEKNNKKRKIVEEPGVAMVKKSKRKSKL